MTASWCCIALVDERDPTAAAAAKAHDEQGTPAGVLAVWKQRAKPVRHALRADERIFDAAGEPASVSLVLAPAGVRLPFDDPAVQQARRRVLAGLPADALSTLLRDASHFEGAITVRRGPDAAALLRDDPFARVFPARLLEVGSGLLGSTPPPVGPTIERYGSERPWPWDRFGDSP